MYSNLDTYQTNVSAYCPVPEAPESVKGRSGIAFSLLGAVLTALVVALLLGKREAVMPIQAARPGPPPLPRVVTASGKMEPFRAIKISPEVSGEIIEIPVTEGQVVKKGDVLMRIKPDFYIASRDQAEGGYKSAQANLAIAEAHLQTARAELKRNQTLSHSKLVSEATLEEAQANYAIAQAQRTSAEGQLETARACLARAQYDVDRTTIVSPINGTVAKLNSVVGERVVGNATMTGTEVMSIADMSAMEAHVTVGERDISAIDRGQKVHLELNAFPGHTFEGTVQEVATSPEGLGSPAPSNDRKVEFAVRIRLQDKQSFRPGMSVTARIQGPPGMTEAVAPTASTKTPGHPWTS
jgi:HlyD family secretion protein